MLLGKMAGGYLVPTNVAVPISMVCQLEMSEEFRYKVLNMI